MKTTEKTQELPSITVPALPVIDLADARTVIQITEAILFKAKPPLPNPYTGDHDPRDFIFDGNATLPRFEGFEYSDLFASEDLDRDIAGTDPDFKRKAILAGLKAVFEFCNRELSPSVQRQPNSLFRQAIAEAVRKTLVQLLSDWYTLEEGGIRPFCRSEGGSKA